MSDDRICRTRGLAFRYRIDTPADRPDAPWLVFSNSLMTDLTLWDDQVAGFGDRFRILRYDQRGHGGTSVPDADCSFALLAGDLLALLDEAGIERTVLMGVSMGAATALALAAGHPERVSRLVLSDGNAATPAGGATAWDERLAIAASGGMAALVEATLGRWFHPGSVAAGHPALARVAAMIRTTPPQGFVRCVRALQSYDFTSALPTIACPTLLIAGEADGAMPKTMAVMAAAIPGARFATVERAGHLPNIEQPDAVNRLLAGFIDGAG